MSNKTSFLACAQQGVYIDCILDPENLRYNCPKIYYFPKGVSAEVVRNATRKALECHPTLFSHFEDRGGDAVQVFPDQCIADVDMMKLADEDVEAVKNGFSKVFDLTKGPLYRAKVLDSPSGVMLLLDAHHLVFDGKSSFILTNEICAAIEGTDPSPEHNSYADFADAQQTDMGGHKAYYDKMFAEGVAPTLLSFDLNGDGGSHAEIMHLISTPDVMTKAKALGTAPSALFMAAAFYTLSRYTNTKNLSMTTISNGRLNPLSEGVVGMFVNTIPLVCKVEDESVSSFIHGIRSMFQETRQHEEYPFASIVSDYGVEQNVRFTYQYGTTNISYSVKGQELKYEYLWMNNHDSPLTIVISSHDGKPAIFINYDTTKYSADLVSRFAESMDAVVAHFLEEPDGRLLSVSIMSEGQQAELANMHQTCIDPSAVRFPLFHNSIEYWAAQTPDATAVIACNETLTYRQLNEKANVLAHALMNKGVVRGDRICLLLPRKSWHLIAMFGVMKTGAAYIPCDPEYPAERIRLITEDSHARYVITTKDKMGDYGDRALDVEVLLNDGSAGSPTNYSNPDVEVSPDDLAYLIYTSGSTGRPKGVMLRHIGICNYLTDHEENRHIHAFVKECKAMMGITTVSFDLSLKELGATVYNGKTLVFANEEEVMSPVLMAELYKRTGCDGFNGTPSRLKMFLELQDFQQVMKDVKVIILGGEKYPASLLPQLRSLTDARLFNTYGPTEITVSSNVGELTHEDKVTVGEPLLNYQEYIVDADDNELPVGVVGELLIGGIGVGGGYNDLPEKTAEAFVEYCGQRVYRSGDYARWMANGKVEILGRKDHQIKLNGLRIELGEVETVLNRQPQVKEGVVMIKTVEGHDHLVAYYVPNTSDAALVDTLKEQMGKSLTDYMVPTMFVEMDKMPISPNGKTDLKALPQPEWQSVGDCGQSAMAAPLNALEIELKAIMASVINTDKFGITDILGRIGFTSLSSIKLATLVYKRFGVQLAVKKLAKTGTLQSIENEILMKWLDEDSQSQSQPSGSSGEMNTQPSALHSQPLSYSQLGVYTECVSHPYDIQYNMPSCIELPKDITSAQVKTALEKILVAHPYPHTHFQNDDKGDVVQCPMENVNIEIPVQTMTEQEFEHEKTAFVRPFSLQEGPLFRMEIVECPTAVYLLLDCHHLIMDGGSYDIFYRQLCQALDGVAIEPERYDYYQFVADQKIEAETEQFFAEQLGQIEEASALLPDRYDNDDNHHQGEVKCPTDLQAVENKCRELNITPASLYLAAVTIAVSKYTAEDTVGICTISNGRSNLRLSGSFGMFVNTLPLVSKVDGNMTVDDYLQQVSENFEETLAHEDYPFAKIAEDYGYAVNIMYAYQVGVRNSYCCNSGALKIQSLELQRAKFPVAVFIEGSTSLGNVITVQYDESLFSKSMMKGFASAVQHVVADLLRCEKIGDVNLCDEEMLTLLDSFNVKSNAVMAEEDADETVLSLFQRAARQYPDNLAAIFKDKEYTYRELDALTDSIGCLIYDKIRNNGKAEPVVSILIPRNEYVFILPLAAMKAGCAYQPLDPNYPQERLNFMVKDADAVLLIADPELKDIINEYEGEVALTSELEQSNSIPLREGQEVGHPLTPQSLFILLYTSGSTGVPKGVMLEHQNLVSFIKWYRRYYDLKPEHNVAAYASFGFDANMMDMYPALTTGATVHVIAEDIRLDLMALNAYYEAKGITHSFITTQVGVQFLLNAESHSLKHLSIGGEKLVSIDPPTDYSLYNAYGPTECTIFTTIMPVQKKEPNIPIGKPTDLLDCYVMDKNLHRLPVGAAGELVIAGKQVGRGYLNRPDKTAEAFFTLNGERAYHSGDIVRYRSDGNIEFVGRKDGQVKIRGFRIELKEVEAVIRDFEGVSDVTVQAYDYEDGGKYIAAFVVSDTSLNVEALNAFIKSQKPPYMVPAVTMQIDNIPLNVNQKVDRKALPKPVVQKAEYVAPEDQIEMDFCKMFETVLGAEHVSVTDDFFEIGGSSIIALKLVVAGNKAGYDIVYNDVFDYTTPRMLAEFVKSKQNADDDAQHQSAEIPVARNDDERTYIGDDGFDYRPLNELVKQNTLENFLNGERQPIGDVLLTGATGFLGIHVLYDLINYYDGKIYCFVRAKKELSAEQRLQSMLFYYFSESYEDLLGKRIFVIEGDATNMDALNGVNCKVDAVVNCAACVKHFAKGNEIENMNVGSVRNLIEWCLAHDARLVHISTGSVAGVSVNGFPLSDTVLTETKFYYGQALLSQYAHSKFIGERLILDAIAHHGLNAKIMRVGNLAPRNIDGEFQINARSNNFMNMLATYQFMGIIPFEMQNNPIEFSPIDATAHSVMLMAQTPKECIVTHPFNVHRILLGDIICELNKYGKPIRMVESEEFRNRFNELTNNPDYIDRLRPLMAYNTDSKTVSSYLKYDSSYTSQLLYRMGFRWPITTWDYVAQFIQIVGGMGMFDSSDD